MSIFSFGETVSGYNYKVLNEREIRGISGLMFIMGIYAFIQVFILNKFAVLPFVSGIMLLHFLVSVIVNPKLSPFFIVARFLVRKQTPIYIGAVQKRFAWSLGAGLSLLIFILSLFLYKTGNLSYFEPACSLCLVCLLLLYLETSFAICVGCKLYFLAIRLNIISRPEIIPRCMGDVCELE